MKGIFRNDLDWDVVLSKAEAEGLNLQPRVTKRIDSSGEVVGQHVDYEWPILLGSLVDESDVVVGTVRLQGGKTSYLTKQDFEKIDRGILFKEEPPHLFIQLVEQVAYNGLLDNGSLTRRVPFHNSQLWIYIQE